MTLLTLTVMGNVLYDNRVAILTRDYDMRMTQIVYIDSINISE